MKRKVRVILMYPKSLRECIDIDDTSMIIHLIQFLKKTVRNPVMVKFGYGYDEISNSFKMNQLLLTFRWIFFGEPLEDESIEMQYDRFMRDTNIDEKRMRLNNFYQLIDSIEDEYKEKLNEIVESFKEESLKTYGRMRMSIILKELYDYKHIDVNLVDSKMMYILEEHNYRFDDHMAKLKEELFTMLIAMDYWMFMIEKTYQPDIFYDNILTMYYMQILSDTRCNTNYLLKTLINSSLISNIKKDHIFNNMMLSLHVILRYGSNKKKDLLFYDNDNHRYMIVRYGDRNVDVCKIWLLYMYNKDTDPNIDNLTYDEINGWKSCNRKLMLAKYDGGGPEELIAQHNYYHMNDPSRLLYVREIDLS